jgi:hypothetical protein
MTKDGDSPNKQGIGGKKDTPECLNKRTFSGQKHWLSDCPKTSEEDKKKISAEYKASRSSSSLSALHVAPVETSAVFNMTIRDRQLTVLADTGATHYAIDRYALETLRSDGVYMATKSLSSSVDLSLAICADPELLVDGDTMKRSFDVQDVASVTLVLQLAAGPLAMRNVQMLVVETSMPRLLLRNPDLVKLGFDVK